MGTRGYQTHQAVYIKRVQFSFDINYTSRKLLKNLNCRCSKEGKLIALRELNDGMITDEFRRRQLSAFGLKPCDSTWFIGHDFLKSLYLSFFLELMLLELNCCCYCLLFSLHVYDTHNCTVNMCFIFAFSLCVTYVMAEAKLLPFSEPFHLLL